MIYMLDTNACIYIINKQPSSYHQKLDLLRNSCHTIAISSIVLSELQYGVANSKHKEQNQIKVNALLNALEVMDFSEECAYFYGILRAELKRNGTMIGSNDLLIASHTICKKAVLITNNVSEFKHCSGLDIECWE